jgi:hypothetical protein
VSDASSDQAQCDESPPFGRSWATLYAIVLVNLAFWIGLFAVLTRAFQ